MTCCACVASCFGGAHAPVSHIGTANDASTTRQLKPDSNGNNSSALSFFRTSHDVIISLHVYEIFLNIVFSFGREPNAAGPSATRINGALLPPLVFRVLALQFLFELRIGLAPERPEILGQLHRAVVRREHLDAERDAAGSNGKRVRAVQILNARGERRRGGGGGGGFFSAGRVLFGFAP